MPNIAVVHLVWVPLGTEPLASFLQSYLDRNAGLAHDLVVVFNGFGAESELEPFQRLLGGVSHQPILIRTPGLDIGSYLTVVGTVCHDYFCFLNSYSRILASDWLAKMYRCVTMPNVGAVGASGSSMSWYSHLARDPVTRESAAFRGPVGRLRHFVLIQLYRLYFKPFPNYHLRSNGFLVGRPALAAFKRWRVRTKLDAHRFESGRIGFSEHIIGMGQRLLVVGADGTCFEAEDWCRSNTYHHGDQENLLIADNRTDDFQVADFRRRQWLCQAAWGDRAL